MAVQVRHEQKYYISNAQYVVLSQMLKAILKPDKNSDENNEYFIRSLYFDTIFDTALNEKINGVRDREKYRIRIYNHNDDIVNMECKIKYNTYISKRSARINRDIAEQIIAGDTSGLFFSPVGLLRDVAKEMTLRLLRPAVIVDYVREAYVHPAEDVRITFDKHLRTGYLSKDIFNPDTPTLPVLSNDQIILEIKFNGMMPPYITNILSLAAGWSSRNAISKYCLCRSFEGKEY